MLLEGRPLRKDRSVAGVRLLLPASGGGGGKDLLMSGVVNIVGTACCTCDEVVVTEPILSRNAVAR